MADSAESLAPAFVFAGGRSLFPCPLKSRPKNTSPQIKAMPRHIRASTAATIGIATPLRPAAEMAAPESVRFSVVEGEAVSSLTDAEP